MKYLHLVWMALIRRKLRTLLTLISVAVAFLLFGLLQSVSSVFTEAGHTVGAAHRLITVSKAAFLSSPLPLSLDDRIRKVTGVTAVSYGSFLSGTYQNPKNVVAAVGVASNYFDLYPEYELTADARRAFDNTQTGAIVGAALARQYHWKVGDRIPLQTKMFLNKNGSGTWTFDLTGVYRAQTSPREQGLFVHWHGLDQARVFNTGTVGLYVDMIADPDQAGQIAARIDALSANSDHETKTQTESAFAADFLNQLVDLGLLVHAIMGAVFFTLILLTGNNMAQAVRERVHEFGILKTLGFSNRKVLSLVLAESVLLVTLGGIGGLILATSVVHTLQSTIGSRLPMMPVGAAIWLDGITVMVLLGLVVAALPAWRGMRLHIVDALARR